MGGRLLSILQVRPGEARLAASMAALFAAIEAGRGIGANAADGLFFVRFGVENLPYMYMALGAVAFVATLSYAAGLGLTNKGGFLATLLLAFALVLLAERAALLLSLPALYPALWLTINVMAAILGTLMWNVAGEVCDARQAKRLFSLFVSAGILGGVLGNFATGPLAKLIGTENLLVVYAALLLLGLGLTRAVARSYFRPAVARATAPSVWTEMRAGFDFVRRSRLMQLMMGASALFSVLFFSVSFPFSKVVSASFPSEAEVAGFLGLFSGGATAATFLVSLLLANRFYGRFGVANAVLLVPVVYLAGFLVWLVSFSLSTAVGVRLVQMLAIGGIGGSAWTAMFNVVPPEKRGQVQAFETGVPGQVGVALSGVLLILGERLLSTTQIFIMGVVVAVACAALVWLMRGGYGQALVAALRAGFVDVFTAAPRGLQGLGADASAVRAAVSGLADPKPGVRRVSAEILGRLGVRQAVEPLMGALSDADAEVRRAVLDALAQLRAPDAATAVVGRMDDADASVRVAAVDALSALAPRELTGPLAVALRDPHPVVRARAAVALHHAGQPSVASNALAELLASTDQAERIAALEALAECADGTPPQGLFEAVRDDSPAVRTAAARALGACRDERAQRLLLEALDDPDERVRREAAVALRPSNGAVVSILEVLRTGSARVQEAALVALDGRGAEVRNTVADWALAEVPRAKQLARWGAALANWQDGDGSQAVARAEPATASLGAAGSGASRASQAVAYLRELLQQREWQVEQRILRGLALLGRPEPIELIARGLKAGDQETRAQALEALETLGDRRVARALVPLLEGSPSETAAGDGQAVLHELSTSPDPWLRALAVYALGQSLARHWRALMDHATTDPEPIVRQAAMGAIQTLMETTAAGGPPSAVGITGGPMPETLRTLGTMERILFLRQVPLFGNLAPEDLMHIAEIATERVFPDGELLCREGELGDELFIIVAGQVRVTKRADGVERTLRTLHAGAHLGELAILREQPRSASVLAQGGDVRTLVIGGQALKSIVRDRQEVAMAMLATLAERLSTLV